jgi:hypothetical protein
MNADTPNTNPTNRDEKGRFRKGNPGGPGNPFGRQVAKLRQIALEAVSEEDLRAIMEVLKEKARQGDIAAIKLLLSYTVGKPQPAVNPDTLDQEELLTILKNHSAPADAIESVVQGTPVELLLKMLRAMLPGLLADKASTAAQTLAESEEEEEDDEPTAEETAEFERIRMENIPPWLHALVDQDRKPEPKPARPPEQGANAKRRSAEPPSPYGANGKANGHAPPSPNR